MSIHEELPPGFRGLLFLIREDFEAHFHNASLPGFRALVVYRYGVWLRTLPRPIQIPLIVIYRLLQQWIRNHYGVNLYWTTKIGRRVIIPNQGNVTIHERSEIGDDCVIRQNSSLGGVSATKNDGPILGRGVEIGAGAVIIGRVRIGDGAKIGPNAVIMTNVPAGAIAVVPPPRIIQPQRPPSSLRIAK